MSPIRPPLALQTVPCPVCGGAVRTTYGQVIDEATVLCSLGHSVHLVDSGGGVRRLDPSLTDLDRQLRPLGGWR